MLRNYLLSSVSHRALNFRSPMGYDQFKALRKLGLELSFLYSSVYDRTRAGEPYETAMSEAMRSMRQRYPRLVEGPQERLQAEV